MLPAGVKLTVPDSVRDVTFAQLQQLAKNAEKARDRAFDHYQATGRLQDKRRQRFMNACLRSAALLEFYLSLLALCQEAGMDSTTTMPKAIREAVWEQSKRKVAFYVRDREQDERVANA